MAKFVIDESKLLKHQREFLKSKKEIVALVSGVGAGKTYAFILKTFMHHINSRNKNGQSNGWIIYPTYSLAEQVFLYPPNGGGFLDMLTKADIEYDYNGQKHRLTTRYGSINIFQLQQPKRIVGAELTFIGFDEFDIESIKNCEMAYLKALARMRGKEGCQLYIVTTPEGFKFTYLEFVEHASPSKHLIRAKTKDNPHLPEGYISRMQEMYDPQMLKQYLEGEFVNLNNLQAYYSFDRSEHVIDSYEFDEDEPVLFGIDFNVDPMCVAVGQQVHGILYIFDEYSLRDANTQKTAELINQKYGRYRRYCYPDMTGSRRQTSADTTDHRILKDCGFTIRRVGKNTRERDRINAVNAAFDSNRVFITKNCTNLIKDLEQVITDTYGEIDKTNRALTHASDAAGYMIQTLYPIVGRLQATLRP